MKLQLALKARNSDAVEVALYEEPQNDSRYIELLIELLPMDWHQSHENIARYLQILKPTCAVPVLMEVATKKFSYLKHDNSLALARKCVWALADIGTQEARNSLQVLSQCGDTEIEGFATKRLNKWNEESARKRA